MLRAATPALHVSATTAISRRIRRRFLRLLKNMATERETPLLFLGLQKERTWLWQTEGEINCLSLRECKFPQRRGEKGLSDGWWLVLFFLVGFWRVGEKNTFFLNPFFSLRRWAENSINRTLKGGQEEFGKRVFSQNTLSFRKIIATVKTWPKRAD